MCARACPPAEGGRVSGPAPVPEEDVSDDWRTWPRPPSRPMPTPGGPLPKESAAAASFISSRELRLPRRLPPLAEEGDALGTGMGDPEGEGADRPPAAEPGR